MTEMFSVAELAEATLAVPFGFSKGVPLLKVPVSPASPVYYGLGPGGQKDTWSVLCDLHADPQQLSPLTAPDIEHRLLGYLASLLDANEAPPECYDRLGVDDLRSTVGS